VVWLEGSGRGHGEEGVIKVSKVQTAVVVKINQGKTRFDLTSIGGGENFIIKL